MPRFIDHRSHLAGLATGLIGAVLLLAATSRPGVAERLVPDPDNCGQGRASMCRLVETCEPKGFEANGTCRWIYTASKYYWRA
jgi:hypothetical protein